MIHNCETPYNNTRFIQFYISFYHFTIKNSNYQYFLFEKITKFITLLTYRQYSYFFTYLENNLYTILYFKTYNLLLPIILATYFLQFYILFYHFTLKKTHIINTFSFVNTTKYIPLFYYAKKHKKIPWRFISNKST